MLHINAYPHPIFPMFSYCFDHMQYSVEDLVEKRRSCVVDVGLGSASSVCLVHSIIEYCSKASCSSEKSV